MPVSRRRREINRLQFLTAFSVSCMNNYPMNNPFAHTRTLVAVATLILAPAAIANDSLVMPEDVFPALQQTLTALAGQSPRMVANNLNLLAADGELEQARSGLYPTLGGFYQYNQTQDQRNDLPGTTLDTDKTYYSLVLTQPLFHWGERRNTARIGEIRREIATENYSEAYRLLAQEVRATYLAVVAGKVHYETARFNRVRANQDLALAEDRLAKKEISDNVVFQNRIAADEAQIREEAAEMELATAKQNLAALTGQPELADAAIPESIPSLPVSRVQVERLLAQFLAQGEPDTAAARIQRQSIIIEDLTYQNQKTRLKPKLNFVAGLSQDEQSYTANLAQKYGVQSRYVGLAVNWSIFDGFAARGATASALARKRLAEHNYKQYTETLARDARRAARMVNLAERQLAISERLLNSSGNFLEYTKADFERGQAAVTDVAKAQAGYNNSLSATNTARANYLLRISEFASLIGVAPTAPTR
jgi:outer membrane protein TolC